MNWDQIKGNWKQVKGKVKEKWGKLTDNDLDLIAGKKDQLVGKHIVAVVNLESKPIAGVLSECMMLASKVFKEPRA